MLRSILDHKTSSSVDFFRVILWHIVSKDRQTLGFIMLFGSPAMLIIVLCTTNGEREEMVSPSFSEWITKFLGL